MRFSCASIFTDHMVLQRRRPVAVFGKGPEGETVEAEFIGHTASTAVRHGEWLLFLPAMDERGAHTLRVRCAGEELAFSDVVLGEEVTQGSGSSRYSGEGTQSRGTVPSAALGRGGFAVFRTWK